MGLIIRFRNNMIERLRAALFVESLKWQHAWTNRKPKPSHVRLTDPQFSLNLSRTTTFGLTDQGMGIRES